MESNENTQSAEELSVEDVVYPKDTKACSTIIYYMIDYNTDLQTILNECVSEKELLSIIIDLLINGKFKLIEIINNNGYIQFTSNDEYDFLFETGCLVPLNLLTKSGTPKNIIEGKFKLSS